MALHSTHTQHTHTVYRPEVPVLEPVDVLEPTSDGERQARLDRIRARKGLVWQEYYYQFERGMNPPVLVARRMTV